METSFLHRDGLLIAKVISIPPIQLLVLLREYEVEEMVVMYCQRTDVTPSVS